VSAHRAVYPIAAMCRVLGVSSSGYYAWAKREPSARTTSNAALIGRIGAIHAASHGTYGSPRVHAELTESGLRVSRKRVARLMKTAGLAGVSRRRFVTTAVRDGGRQAPDLVGRAFKAEAPNMLWVADITYIPTWSGFLYLAIVLDVFSRRIVGWSMSLTLHTDVVLAALNMALAVRKPKSVIHHSDQGSQYTSIAFGNRCREAGVRPSMGSAGDAYDNAMAESFFATLECELLDRRRFKTQAEARMAVFAFVEGFYNPRRRHSALGYLSPMAFERQHTLMTQKPSASSPGNPNHAAVLAPIKHEPCRARKSRVLDRDCARQQSLCMGRGEGTVSAAAEQRNWMNKEDDTTPAAQLP
jgi:putative transposase